MIHIVYDTQNLITNTSDKTIRSVGEYPAAYSSISIALQSNTDLKLVVFHSTVFQWIKNLSQRYPQGTFVFETLDARQAFAQKWGQALPDDLRNEEILESGLLQLDLHGQPGQDFSDLLLVHFYAPLFSAKTFPFTQLPQLFQAVDAATWQANRANLLLARTLHQRFKTWKNRANSAEQRQVIEWFAADPGALETTLMQFRVLRAVPGLGETLLGDRYAILSALKLPLQDLPVDATRIPETVNQVICYLNQRLPTSPEELAAFIELVSGLLWAEYEIIEKVLRSYPEWLSNAILAQVEDRFEAFHRRLSKPLANLRAQIRPPYPPVPDLDWDAAQMLDWATRLYLPYQAWASTQEQFDPALFALGDQFSAWVSERWSDLHANSGRMVFNILPHLAAELKDPTRIHLMLVVDNLGWSFGEMLRDLFQDKGFFLLGVEPYLAMLPTHTEISKKCLLSGAVGYIALDETSYTGILEKGWVPYFGQDNAIRYLSDISKLGQVGTLDARVYVVNYLAVDTNLHKSADEIGMTHREHIRHLLAKLVENVIAFVETHDLQDRLRVHIVSDHGSTQIPASLPNDLDPASFKQSGYSTRSHRYVEVDDARFATLADNLRHDCFFLPANDFLLPTNVLCARRANRFLPTDKDFFVHGGALPEEMVVPYMAFEPATVPIQPLTILLMKNLFRYRLETVDLQIGNPNDFAVEHVQVTALNGNVEWGDVEPIPLLNGHRDTKTAITARFKPTSLPEEQTALRLRVRFRARGEPHTVDVKLSIEMRRMVEEKSSGIFDD